MALSKTITYDHGDYRMELDGQLIGYAPTYSQAEKTLDDVTYDWLIHGNTATSDPPPPIPPDQDPYPGIDYEEYKRDPKFDQGVHAAWRDRLGLLRWCVVGTDPNR